MPNANDRKIIERIANDSALEMNHHELEELLEHELSKPAEEMDVQLLKELLEVLQPDEVPQTQKQEIWQNVSYAFLSERRKTHPLLRRFAVVAAIVVLLLGLTIGAASAFRWTFLWKWLEPMAETFGIYRNYSETESSDTSASPLYTIEETEFVQELYTDLSKIPDTFMGYAVKPEWIPEGYEFLQATVYSDFTMCKYTIDYIRGNDEMSTSVTFYLDGEAILNHLYERTVDVPIERTVGQNVVSFYRNANDNIQLVSWIDGEAHYNTRGHLTIEEVERIVCSFVNEQ